MCPSTSTTRSTKRKSNANETCEIKKKKATDTKNPLNSQNNDVDGNEQSPENEDAGIIEEFDYHDSMDAENYEKYFEKICKLLKPNSLIIIDNARISGISGISGMIIPEIPMITQNQSGKRHNSSSG